METDKFYEKRVDLGSDAVSFTLSCYEIKWISPWHQRCTPLQSFTERHSRRVAKLVITYGERVWELLKSLEHMPVRYRVAAVSKWVIKRFGYGPFTEKRYIILCISFAIILVYVNKHGKFLLYWNIMRGLYFLIYNPPWYWRSLSNYFRPASLQD